MIDHEVRFVPASQAARDHMRKGSIGALKAVYVRLYVRTGRLTQGLCTQCKQCMAASLP